MVVSVVVAVLVVIVGVAIVMVVIAVVVIVAVQGFLVFLRTLWHGSPKLYANWVDEGLNVVLRDCAKFAHRLTFEFRVFSLLALRNIVGGQWWCKLVSLVRR